jgi:acyl-homoserine lactone acylase PvdQ
MAKTREFQALLDACSQEGCIVCRLTQESTHRYLDNWKYELFTDVTLRMELRHTRGFCHMHTWQLAAIGASLQLAQSYREIISDAMEQLQQGGTGASGGGLLHRLFESKRGGNGDNECPACRQKAKAEERYAQTLQQALTNEEFYRRFTRSQGLCLDHFRLTSELKTTDNSTEWLPLLQKAQMGCLQRLDAQLGELIRKHDYRFQDEERGQEMVSWKRAAGLVAGEEDRIQG